MTRPASPGADRPVAITSVAAGDPGYQELAARSANARFRPRPAAFRLVRSTGEAVRAVSDASALGMRLSVRSGGHCYEDFVASPAPGMVADLAGMHAVYFDPGQNAFAVEAGAKLIDLYRALYRGWGVTIPGGVCGEVAAGGHVVGGGYGALSRQFGIAADHLHAVEVVVADRPGRARAVVATREPRDPCHDLWWAHTGGGGGNFGVVTRYWFRSPAVGGRQPEALLPRPPGEILSSRAAWSWRDMDRGTFRRLIKNHGEWYERNSGPGSRYASMFAGLVLLGRQPGSDPGYSVVAHSQIDGTLPDADRLLRDYMAALADGVTAAPAVSAPGRQPWLASVATLAAAQDSDGSRQKIKSAYLRRCLSGERIDVIYGHLSGTSHASGKVSLSLQSYGGAVNSAAPGETAMPHRDSILIALFLSTWDDPLLDRANTGWLARFYRDIYAGSGGVPVPGGPDDGCFINYPDTDLADPRWNTSGVPWHYLYYKDNYKRLQEVKARWDPAGIFRHSMSVR